MADQTNSLGVPEVVIGYPVPPSSSTPPRPPPRWWHRPIAIYPSPFDRKATRMEETAYCIPRCGGLLTLLVFSLIVFFIINRDHCHVKFSIQSVAFSPSSATWHVDFLVKNPGSRYSIYYDDNDASLRLGRLNAAVLTNSHRRRSRDHTAFSLAFIADGNRSDVVSQELDIKLRAKYRRYITFVVQGGHLDVRCPNLTRSHEKNVSITCQSSFTNLKKFC